MQKCWICGETATKHRGIGEREGPFKDLVPFSERSQRCYCEKCYDMQTAQIKADMTEYVRLKKKLMFERAVRLLERQNLQLYDYKEAIDAVEEFFAENPDKFDSAYEVVAAIILIDNEIECKLQYKVGRYQCDFCLPAFKVLLEIDGDRHTKERDSERDEAILQEIGYDWEIVRIKTEYLDQKADLLVEAIETVLRKRKRDRQKLLSKIIK